MEVAQGLTLNTWLYLPPDREIKDVLLVTDGEVHAEEVPLLNLYQPHDSAIVYFSPEEASLRGDFLGNIELVASSLKNHVLPWAKTLAEQKGKVWPVDASDYIIAGGSLGGYAAAGIVLIHPEIALNAIVQSAALWWPDRQYWLLESWQEHIDAPAGIKRAIFHEYGRYDIRLSQENVELANVLSQADNVTSTSREYNGGHNYLSWRQGPYRRTQLDPQSPPARLMRGIRVGTRSNAVLANALYKTGKRRKGRVKTTLSVLTLPPI